MEHKKGSKQRAVIAALAFSSSHTAFRSSAASGSAIMGKSKWRRRLRKVEARESTVAIIVYTQREVHVYLVLFGLTTGTASSPPARNRCICIVFKRGNPVMIRRRRASSDPSAQYSSSSSSKLCTYMELRTRSMSVADGIGECQGRLSLESPIHRSSDEDSK